jgi:hypothetical protein
VTLLAHAIDNAAGAVRAVASCHPAFASVSSGEGDGASARGLAGACAAGSRALGACGRACGGGRGALERGWGDERNVTSGTRVRWRRGGDRRGGPASVSRSRLASVYFAREAVLTKS